MEELHTDQRYLELAEKWLNGTISSEEEKEYADWYNTITPDAHLEVPAEIATDREQHRRKILRQINYQRVPVIQMYKKVLQCVSVAAIILLMAGSSYFYFRHPEPKQFAVHRSILVTNDVKSGTYGAILTRSNGQTIILDTVKNGKIMQVIGSEVTKAGKNLTFANAPSPNNKIEYYTLSTPRARQQQLMLPDGTQIWLNAQSSVKFPSTFTGTRREVEITGEAYFEVIKDASKPFIVNVNNAEIEVLGTHFNVMAYNNESTLETTLLEGSVKFRKGNNQIFLKPGQQSQLFHNAQIRLVDDVNLDQIVAWKNGMQSFNSADIKTIMRQVERWYDVDVEYKGNMTMRKFTGDIPRDAKLSEILKLFEVNKIHFQMDAAHRKLTVML
jgi:transmembrane sensor